MRKRKRMNRGRSRKIFTRGAQRVHGKNGLHHVVLRGGVRL